MEDKKKYLLTITYDGSSFAGWQTQSNGLAIQALIEDKLKTVLRDPTPIFGSGRTDSGVHALAQTAHFETTVTLDPYNLRHRLNSLLPQTIRILDIFEVPSPFHARFSVKQKTYRYLIVHDKTHDPFLINKAWHVSHFLLNGKKRSGNTTSNYIITLDYEKMKQACDKLKGLHDFKAFAAKNSEGTASKDSIRDLIGFDLIKENNRLIFELSSKGFLYKMVRNLIGTVIEIGAGKLELDVIDSAFNTGLRSGLGATAPACGLYLKSVEY